jgi:hypothetical protein
MDCVASKESNAVVLGSWRGGQTPQEATHATEHHRLDDPLTQSRQGGFGWRIEYRNLIVLLSTADIADTRKPCQGPAHIQGSEPTQQAINPQRGAAEQVGIIGRHIV